MSNRGSGAYPRQDGVFVLDAVSLIDDDVSEVKLLEVILLLDDHLIGSDHHIELAGLYMLVLLVRLHSRKHLQSLVLTERWIFRLSRYATADWRNWSRNGSCSINSKGTSEVMVS